MAETRVALPEPRPEDDADVVWGLSTAKALWARGERGDALVWLRRAAEAAESAGQTFRASGIGLYISELEDVVAADVPQPRAVMHALAEIESPLQPLQPGYDDDAADTIADATVAADQLDIRRRIDDEEETLVRRHPQTSQPPAQTGGQPRAIGSHPQVLPPPPLANIPWGGGSHPGEPRAAGPRTPPPQAPSAAIGGPPVHAFAPPTQVPPSGPPQVAPPPSPPTGRASAPLAAAPMQGLPAPHASGPPAPPPPPAVPRLATTPPMPPAPPPIAPRATAPPIPAPTPSSTAPPVQQPAAPPPGALPLGSESALTIGADAVSEVRPEARHAATSLEADSEPPMAVRPARHPQAGSTSAAPPAAADPQNKRRRAPILDPWSDTEAPRSTFLTRREARATESRASDPRLPEAPHGSDPRTEATGPRPEPTDVELREDAVVVSVRSRPQALPEEDDEVVTSAVPLEALRRRTARVPPPPPAPRPKPPSDGAKVSGEVAIPPPAITAAPLAPKAPTPPPPPPPLSAPPNPPLLSSAGDVAIRPARKPGPQGGPQAEPISARAKLAPDSVPSKSGGPAVATSGPQIPIAQRTIAGLPLDRAAALSELPHDAQAMLVAQARVERLGPDEEVSGFGVALVVDGDAFVSATIVDAPAHRLQSGALVPSRGNLGEAGVAMRVVAGASGARVAVWDAAVFEPLLEAYPTMASELRDRADRLQALAGTTLGPLGELDETYRNLAVERLTVRFARPEEVLAVRGTPMRGLAIVAAGTVVVEHDDGTARELGPGELLFPDAVLRALPAPANARAAEHGALLLVGERRLAEELMVTVPPLVEILGA